MPDASDASPATTLAAPPAPPLPRKRGFLGRLTRWLVVLLVLVALAPLALKLGFVRDFVAQKASAALGAPVSIAEASAWWTSGIDLRGLVVASPPGHDGPLARVEHVHVDVALFKLLKGDVDAHVLVERPVVTLRRDAQLRWNTADLAGEKRPSDGTPREPSARSAGPQLTLEIVDGVFEAHGVSPTVERVSDIDLQASLAADGALGATLGLIAEKAGLAGADARLTFSGGKAPGEPSPFEAQVPALSLERLAGLIEGLTGVKGLQGTASLTAKGRLDAEGRLSGALKLGGQGVSATSPQGTRLRLGKLEATLDAIQGAAGESGRGSLTLTDLELVSGTGAEAQTFVEPQVTARFDLARGPDGAGSLALHGVSSSIARLTGPQPFVIQQDAAGGLSFAGPLDLAVDLDALTRAFGAALGLRPGERLRGALTLKGGATGSSDSGRFEATLTGTGLSLPPSWSANRALAAIEGRLLLAWTEESLTLEARGVNALGLTAEGEARFEKQGATTPLVSADARVEADLAQVRAWFGPLLGLDPAATLAGRVQSVVKVTLPAEGLRLEGTTQTAGLAYRATPGGSLLEEPGLSIEHTFALAQGEGPTRFEVLRLRGNGYQADLSGSSVGGADGALDLRGTIAGDAARVAERVAAFLGPDLKDLKGQGQVAGRFALQSQGEALVAGSTVDLDLTLGTWTSSGAVLSDARLTVKRASTREPYLVEVVSGANGGSATARLTLTPQGEALAWTLASTLKGVDMSTIVTTGPVSRKLAYVLPTLLPMNSATPVLSGKLDATVDLRASDLGGDALLTTLAGTGNLALTQGTLGQSSLFAALGTGGGGGGLGEVGKVLAQVAPEVGKELANLTRAVAYQEITSRFTVAQQRVEVLETKMTAQAHRLDLKGVVTFDQRVDLTARLWLGSKAGEELKRVLPDQTLPLRIRNTLAQPQVVPDLKTSDLMQAALPTPAEILKDPKKALDEAKKLKDRWKELLPK